MHIKYILSDDNMYSIVIFKNFDCLNSFHNYYFTKVYFGNVMNLLNNQKKYQEKLI